MSCQHASPQDEQTLFWITRWRIISGRRKVTKTQAKQANKQNKTKTKNNYKNNNIKAIPQCGTQYSVTIIYFILFIFLTAERHHLLCERKERKRKRNLPQVLASDGMIFYNCWKTLSPLRMNKTTTTKTTTSPQILTWEGTWGLFPLSVWRCLTLSWQKANVPDIQNCYWSLK